MAVEYEISVMDRTGAEQYRLTGSAEQDTTARNNGGYLSLEYTKDINAPGLLTFDVDAGHDVIGNIELDWQIEVLRRDLAEGIGWYVDFGGLWRAQRRQTDREGRRTWRGFCPGYLHFLTRSSILYPADTTNRDSFSNGKAETISKFLVTYNATVAGTTADGRDRAVDSWGANISIQADALSGNSFDYKCSRMNLLRALQEVALLGGGDFDLIRTAAQAWEFRWYAGQRGTDRRTTLVFSLLYGNMENPDLYENYIDYPTVAVVAGQGVEYARQIEIRTASDHNSLYRSSEAYVDARSYSTVAGLQAHGDLWLAEQRQNRVQLNFDPVQTEAYNYGLQYFHGDIFTARYEEVEAVKQFIKTTVSVQPGSDQIETIKLVTKNV